jgi:hypothetical protein
VAPLLIAFLLNLAVNVVAADGKEKPGEITDASSVTQTNDPLAPTWSSLDMIWGHCQVVGV